MSCWRNSLITSRSVVVVVPLRICSIVSALVVSIPVRIQPCYRDEECLHHERYRWRESLRQAKRGRFARATPPKSVARAALRMLNFVGEIDKANPMCAVEPTNLCCDTARIAIPPPSPKAALATIATKMKATARELKHWQQPIGPCLLRRQGISCPSGAYPESHRFCRWILYSVFICGSKFFLIPSVPVPRKNLRVAGIFPRLAEIRLPNPHVSSY